MLSDGKAPAKLNSASVCLFPVLFPCGFILNKFRGTGYR